MIAEFKWLIPTCAGVAIAVLALMRPQMEAVPWSRAFIIAASLLLATTPIIASGELTPDGLKITTLGQAAVDSAAALKQLDDRISTNEKKVVEVRNLLTTLAAALPAATPPDNKAKLDAQLKALTELTAKSGESKAQFDAITKDLDRQLRTLQSIKPRF